MIKQPKHILNSVFLISLVILLLNDHFLKASFHNGVTGKLSDIFGIIVFVQFLSIFGSENSRKYIYLFSAIAFTVWKLELSTSFIETWNKLDLFTIGRTVDYTDLFCLSILIPVYFHNPGAVKFTKAKIFIYPLAAVAFMAITATTIKSNFAFQYVYVDKFIKSDLNKEEFLKTLTDDHIRYKRDSIYVFEKDTFERYELNDIILNQDTIRKTLIGIRSEKNKTKIYIESMFRSEDQNLPGTNTFHEIKKLERKYKVKSIHFFKNLDE